MIDEPPPLTIGSDASKILLRLWRGERYVHHASPASGAGGAFEDHVTIATTVVGQLRLRARLRIYVVATSIDEQLALHHSLRTALPTTPIGVTDGDTSRMIPRSERIPVNAAGADGGYIHVSGPWGEGPGGLADLIVVLTGPDFVGEHLVRYLVGSKQLLVLGEDWYAAALQLADRTDLEVPFDVAIAGDPR